MPIEEREAKTKEAKKVEEPAVVSKEEYDRVVSEYSKLANAFNKLLKDYNDMHLKLIFTEEAK